MAKIKIFRGVTYPVRYQHEDTDGNPVSLVGSTLYFTVKTDESDSNATDTNALIKKTVSSHTDAAGGISEFTLNDTDTWIEPGDYYFDFIVEDSSGLAAPPSVYGMLTVLPHPTNRNVGNE